MTTIEKRKKNNIIRLKINGSFFTPIFYFLIFIINISMAKNINIKFPFKDSVKGFFLDMNSDDISAIKSDLMHLLLTNKGERYYLPDYGTNLRKFLFSPNDNITHSEMQEEVSEAVKKYIPNLIITNLTVSYREGNDYFADIKADFTIQDGVFEKNDSVTITF